MRSIVVLPIRAYQRIVSPALPRSCKYHPSCSQYAVDAVMEYGVVRGVVLALWRVLRCNPLSDGGFDPVERQRLFRSARRASAREIRREAAATHGGPQGAAGR